jgi:hypothetical protein
MCVACAAHDCVITWYHHVASSRGTTTWQKSVEGGRERGSAASAGWEWHVHTAVHCARQQ